MQKLKMSLRKFLIIWVPILTILLAIMIAVTAVANYYSASLDTYLGKGKRIATNPKGSENWDTEYYDQKYSTDDGENGSLLAAAATAKKISDEGEVLLKNNGVLPLAENSKVTPFGYRYTSPIYGGTGSGNVDVSASYVTTAKAALASSFSVNTAVEELMNKATPYEITEKGIAEAQKAPSSTNFNGAGTSIMEYNPSIYESAAASCGGTVGIVFIGRVGGEGSDLKRTGYIDGTPHQLALSEYEKNTIKFAKNNCDKVVVIVNSSNVMQLDLLEEGELEADAVLWIGGPGAKGFASMGDILTGKVVPSGKTADIFPANLANDPSFVNMSATNYTNIETGITIIPIKYFAYIEYEEGIYVGYRYYETRAAVDDKFDYEGNVVYPFGYGLSYTTFSQKITGFDASGDDIKVTVEVKNTGTVRAGKDVVQIYFSAPFTQFSIDNKIEKSEIVLAGFAKTKLIAPGGTDEVTVTFAKEDMASYCYTRTNPDGTKGAYVLEEGDYKISLRSDSHSVIEEKTVNIAKTVWYDNSNPRQYEKDAQSMLNDDGTLTNIPAKKQEDKNAEYIAATNRFEESNDYMSDDGITNLSRTNFAGTFPTAPTVNIADDYIVNTLNTLLRPVDLSSDPELGTVEGSKVYKTEKPTEKAEKTLTVADMRGVDFYDDAWNQLLDQIDYDDPALRDLLLQAAFKTSAISSIGKPETIDHDGPQGLTLTGVNGNWGGAHSWCAYPSSVVLASSWNTELAYEMGEAVGQEALTTGVNGWYAPGANTHRSPFSGRNFEYYSEDPVLSGKICSGVISGSSDCGVIAYLKHFFLNDQENSRGVCLTWANEQTMREIYLRAFEISVKEARMTIKYIGDEQGTVKTKTMRGALGMMTAMNYIGTRYCGSSYASVTEILRGEWGFTGAVITDMTNAGSEDPNRALRAGVDLWMTYMPSKQFTETESATSRWVIRNALHNICYAVANSNTMQNAAPGAIISYTMSPWMIGLVVANVAVYSFIIGMGVYVTLRIIDVKKHPEKYKSSKQSN